MCLEERNTESRGRPLLPAASTQRTRCWRRSNWFSLPCMASASLLLAFLAVDVLAPVANALALVGLGRTRGADHGRHLPDLLLVDAGDLDDLLLGARHLHVDAGRDLVHHVVAEADLQLQLALALEGRAEPHAVDLERMRVALGHALDEVRDLRARHAPHRARELGLLARFHLDAGRALLHLDQLRTGEGELTLGAFHLHRLAVHRRRDAGGNGDRISANARHLLLPASLPSARYNTLQRISPPTFSSRARASDITPFGVERMATPSPLATLLRSRTALYTRRPGLDTRAISRIAGWPLEYLSSISNSERPFLWSTRE